VVAAAIDAGGTDRQATVLLPQNGVDLLPQQRATRVADQDAVIERPGFVAETNTKNFELNPVVLRVGAANNDQDADGTVV
jgi:hypothetical protein